MGISLNIGQVSPQADREVTEEVLILTELYIPSFSFFPPVRFTSVFVFPHRQRNEVSKFIKTLLSLSRPAFQ